jgi:hypothetical protein
MAHDKGEANKAGKWLAKEENGNSGDSSNEEEVDVALGRGGSNPE